jgi:hypothetical protein
MELQKLLEIVKEHSKKTNQLPTRDHYKLRSHPIIHRASYKYLYTVKIISYDLHCSRFNINF